MENKRLIARKVTALVLLLGICIPLVLGALNDMEIGGDLKLKTSGKALYFNYNGHDVILRGGYSAAGDDYKLQSPSLTGELGVSFLSSDSSGNIIVVSLANSDFDGDIQGVWTVQSGDVGSMTAAAGDTLNATSADSTIPWKVSTTANQTTEGQAVWKSDDNFLAVGDGANTTAVGPPTYPPANQTASGFVGQMAYDYKYVYCYVATNTWKRAELSTWTESYWIWPDNFPIVWPDGDLILFSE